MRYRVFIALGVIFLPLVVRGLWFYEGIFPHEATVSIPDYVELSAPIAPLGAEPAEEEISKATGKVVVVDWAHENQFYISELEEMVNALVERGAEIEIIQSDFLNPGLPLYERLKYATAYVSITPNKIFSDTDVQLLSRFVNRGGRLLVISDPTRREESFGYSIGSVTAANSLLAPFDLSFSDDYLYNLIENEGNYRNVLFSYFGEDTLTEGLSTVAFYGVRSIITKTGTPLIIGDQNTLSSRTDTSGEWAAAARSLDGRVIAIGDLTFLTPPYDQVADNPLLTTRLVDFLLGGEKLRDLSDFPYLFNQPVAILKTETFDLAAETLWSIMGVQGTLTSQGLPLTLVSEPSSDMDLIIFDLYSPSEDVQPYLELFEDVVLPIDAEDGFLTVPCFGGINPAGIGLVLLSRAEERTTLVLLAETNDELLTLAEMLADYELRDCLVCGQVALCKVGTGVGFEFQDDFGFGDLDFGFDESLNEEFPSTDIPLFPTPIPTETP